MKRKRKKKLRKYLQYCTWYCAWTNAYIILFQGMFMVDYQDVKLLPVSVMSFKAIVLMVFRWYDILSKQEQMWKREG